MFSNTAVVRVPSNLLAFFQQDLGEWNLLRVSRANVTAMVLHVAADAGDRLSYEAEGSV